MKRTPVIMLSLFALVSGCGASQDRHETPPHSHVHHRSDRRLVNVAMPSGGQCKDSPAPQSQQHPWTNITDTTVAVRPPSEAFLSLEPTQRRLGYWLSVTAHATAQAKFRSTNAWRARQALLFAVARQIDELPESEQAQLRGAIAHALLLGHDSEHMTSCSKKQLRRAALLAWNKGERPFGSTREQFSRALDRLLGWMFGESSAPPTIQDIRLRDFPPWTATRALDHAIAIASPPTRKLLQRLKESLDQKTPTRSYLAALEANNAPVLPIMGTWRTPQGPRFRSFIVIPSRKNTQRLQNISEATERWWNEQGRHRWTSTARKEEKKHRSTWIAPVMIAGSTVDVAGDDVVYQSPGIYLDTPNANVPDIVVWNTTSSDLYASAVYEIVSTLVGNRNDLMSRDCFVETHRALSLTRATIGYPAAKAAAGHETDTETLRPLATALALGFLHSPQATHLGILSEKCVPQLENTWIAEQIWNAVKTQPNECSGDSRLMEVLTRRRTIELTKRSGHVDWSTAPRARWDQDLTAVIGDLLQSIERRNGPASKKPCTWPRAEIVTTLGPILGREHLPKKLFWIPLGIRPISEADSQQDFPWRSLPEKPSRNQSPVIQDATVDETVTLLEELLAQRGVAPWP